jgi:hypothetical protein
MKGVKGLLRVNKQNSLALCHCDERKKKLA